jgi:spore maturation protein B
MEFIQTASVFVIPLILCGVVGCGLFKRVNVFECFTQGALEGLKSAARILPALIGLIAAIAMLRASGTFELLNRLAAPLTRLIHMPPETLPLALMRPVSGSGALAVVSELFQTDGPDSLAGRTASVMMGSTETTFYALAVYFGAVGIKRTRYTVSCALLADFAGILAAVWITRLFGA